MNRTKFLLAFLLIAAHAISNPIAPKAFINEIYIDSLGNWTIEMFSYDFEYIDSVRLESSSGSSLISYYTPNLNYISLIADSNLAATVSINGAGDYVKLISYVMGYMEVDSVSFGDYPGSYLDCINAGESVAFVYYQQSQGNAGSFCIDTSPTLGIVNDTTGAVGTYSGMIYDPDGYVITSGFFPFVVNNMTIHINEDGSFSERLFSRRYTLDEIAIRFPPFPWTIISYSINPLDFCLRPDSTYYQDIVTTGLVTIKEREKSYENIVMVSPNPFVSGVTFYVDHDRFDPGQEYKLVIFSFDGKRIHVINISDNQDRYDWSPSKTTPSGVLIYHLTIDGRPVHSGKMIKI